MSTWCVLKYYISAYRIAESLAGVKYGESTLFEHLRINRSANRLLIVTTNLDGFSVANHGRSAKFAKLSRYTVCDCFAKTAYVSMQILAY